MKRVVNIREWTAGKRTKKGITWKNLTEQIPYVDEASENRKYHRGNVYYSVGEGSVCVDVRHPDGTPKMGICLRSTEYKRLKELLPEIGRNLPELMNV